jgi:hypothetical protein
MTISGEILSKSRLADCFLGGWTQWNDIVGYRDGYYMLVRPSGVVFHRNRIPNFNPGVHGERAAFLNGEDTFVWGSEFLLETEKGVLVQSSAPLGHVIAPSPDGRYIAVARNQGDLWIYDTVAKLWSNLGHVTISPSQDWDYLMPTWSPWFSDSSRIAFVSDNALIVSSPDGRRRTKLLESIPRAGLAVPSPDGINVAYVTFEPRPMHIRPDLKFWGGTTVWTIGTNGTARPVAVSKKSDDTTYSLHWLGNTALVFDRIADVASYEHARLWKTAVGLAAKEQR